MELADAEADVVVVSDELGVELADAEAVALGVALAVSDPDALAVADGSAASPRMTGAAASAALPPHPARSITAHAMTAPAAFAVFEPGSNAPKRLLRALMWGRASPGLRPITVHEASGYGLAAPRHYRVSTVLAPRRNLAACAPEHPSQERTQPESSVSSGASDSAGDGITVLPLHAELTTQQAADILNVSRPHLVKLLEDGRIEYRTVGTHRRVLAHSLMVYLKCDDGQRRSVADELTALSQEMGLP